MRFALLLAVAPILIGAKSADKLPLMRGIFVGTDTACKGAPNVSITSYWGGNNALNISQATCTIKSMRIRGSEYVLNRHCSGRDYDGDDTIKLVVKNSKNFSLDGNPFRWCGTKVEF